MTVRPPPGRLGMPYVGESFAIFASPYTFAVGHNRKYGPVFKTRFLGTTTAILLGAEANRYVLAGNPRNFSAKEGYSFVAPVLGGSLLMTDDEEHSGQRRLVAPAFHQRNMPDYLAQMNTIIDAQLDTWGQQGRRTFYPEVRRIAFVLASALFLGVGVGDEYDRLSADWQKLGQGLNGVIRVDSPLTAYGRGMAAMRRLNGLFTDLIRARRAAPQADVISLLTAARDEDGATLTDDQIIRQLRLLFFAGYDTTSGTLAWLVAELLRQPEVLEQVRAEIRAEDRDAPITVEDLRQKPLLDAVIHETLRLHPQVIATTRGVRADFEFGGFTIPAGWNVMLIPSFSQRQPEYFADPDRFDPDRFLAPREEDKAHPYAWIGFGGGPHICLGEGIAKIEIKAMITRLLRRYDLKLAEGQDFTPLYVPLSRPKGDVPIHYQAR